MVAADGAPALEGIWRLTPGVGLIEGTLIGPDGPAGPVYGLFLPDGRRYELSEPLYRLAEQLQGRLSVETIADRLSARLGRTLDAPAVTALIESRLAPRGAARHG